MHQKVAFIKGKAVQTMHGKKLFHNLSQINLKGYEGSFMFEKEEPKSIYDIQARIHTEVNAINADSAVVRQREFYDYKVDESDFPNSISVWRVHNQEDKQTLLATFKTIKDYNGSN